MNYASSDEQARLRYKEWSNVDPFPELAPSLLSSENVKRYVEKTGMIYPFRDSPKHLKVAAYEVALLGECVSWDGVGEKKVFDLKEGDELVIEPNSITFVGLEPHIRLPNYIAARFNLKITHVYRGLLAGTGPLVDPGYDNKLFVPLHNLTTNRYVLVGGQPLVWMEFTKLQIAGCDVTLDVAARFGSNLTLGDFLRKADPHRPIRSSIPDSIGDAVMAANRAENRVSRIQLAGVLGIILAMIGVVYPMVSLQRDAAMINSAAIEKLNEAKSHNEGLLKRVTILTARLEALEKRVKTGEVVVIDPPGSVTSNSVKN